MGLAERAFGIMSGWLEALLKKNKLLTKLNLHQKRANGWPALSVLMACYLMHVVLLAQCPEGEGQGHGKLKPMLAIEWDLEFR